MEKESLDLVKFPRTFHLFDAGNSVGRDDLLHDTKSASVWFKNKISLEEKVDGSNLGISINESGSILFQNRSHFVNTATQTQVNTELC